MLCLEVIGRRTEQGLINQTSVHSQIKQANHPEQQFMGGATGQRQQHLQPPGRAETLSQTDGFTSRRYRRSGSIDPELLRYPAGLARPGNQRPNQSEAITATDADR